MIVGALVLPRVIRGITEASTTRRPSNAVDAQLRVDHRAHRAGRGGVVDASAPARRTNASRSASESDCGHAERRPLHRAAAAPARAISSAIRIPRACSGDPPRSSGSCTAPAAWSRAAGARSITRPRLVGLDHHRTEAVAVVGRRGQPLVEEQRRREVELDVGRLEPGARAEEAAALGDVRAQRPAALGLAAARCSPASSP